MQNFDTFSPGDEKKIFIIKFEKKYLIQGVFLLNP